MANVTTHIADTGFRSSLSSMFGAIGRSMTAYMERRSRTDQVQALMAKSDAELARLGITRDGIPAYVFRDLFYV
ncbi:hypothetical protein OB2597_07045 [Pseudooceanicola batsensis HTCC2597]|uniref:DUF1127 domain-containing protein n=1 Tax=Pseudooceanicola batsensis (strain ATCC BAA-863 / DSM 15984 / KCTC 12145 / HTCC2597) TaxID=252305 RepID=A3TTP4_PSEBH|nr:hypothetical protein OB2597_07045 [Pseudooceanicola batsensis HTCC2597]